MKPLKLKYLFYGLILTGSQAFAQMEPIAKEGNKEFNLTVFIGSAFSNLSSDYESQLKTSGLQDIYNGNKLDGPSNTPSSEAYLVTDIEAGYFMDSRNGLSMNFALYDKTNVQGYQNIGNGNLMSIYSEVWSFSVNYNYRTKNKKHTMSLGPAFIWHGYRGSNLPETFDKKMGLHMGYSFQLVQQENWFLSLKMNYRMAPKSAVGPFIREHTTTNDSGKMVTHTSTFPVTELNISSLNIGGTVGVKLNWNKQ